MLDQTALLSPLDPADLPLAVDAFLPDPATLVAEWADLRGDAGLGPVLGRFGASPADLLATPASARAGLLAVAMGRGFYHHELRVRLPMPEELAPEAAVWGGSTVPSWQDGVLAEPKYFSFCQDDPHSAMNPNHRGKWRGHELLHGVVGFCWHPAITRFELYLGARIAEILPVVHWYALDELYRPRCHAHAGRLPPRESCPACERLAAAAPFWDRDRAPLRPQARAWAERARDHLALEWDAILAELHTGQRHRTRPLPGDSDTQVDGSRDAEGYLLGHWNRLTAWSFGAWVERFLVPGVDYADTVDAMARRLASTCHALTSGPLSVDLARADRLARRKLLQDLGYRLLLLVEHTGEGGPVERTLLPQVDALAGAAADLIAGEEAALDTVSVDSVVEDALAAVDTVAMHLPEGLAAAAGALGYRWCLREAAVDGGLDQLVDGLDDALPDSFGGMPDREEVAWRFADSDAFDGTGSLAARFLAWWEAEGGPDLDALRFEATLRDLPRRDPEAELFAVLPPEDVALQPPALRANQTLRRAWIHPSVLGDDIAAIREDTDGRVEIAVAWLGGEPHIVLLDDALAEGLDSLGAGHALDPALARRLLEVGLAVWWGPPGSG